MAKILIVDDDASIGHMIKDILEFKDHEVTLSQKPLETKENIVKNKIELVLLDKLISGVDGTEVCSNLKKDEEVSEVPVIMMSALHNAAEICKEAGAVDFISKPFDMEMLLSRIDHVLQAKEENKL
ncbi:response regulator [Salegentibacter sp. F188]|uniref:Response regulator n=1 Tax=Autumnicola patrickiae TaxID=3075591 RepID=A0ABU3E2I8_9FLAO|nr:response regulator [Salegentibacter sp. F188]MDT0690186.1 response regulator [Salegentibacter sp. F188]